MKTCLQRCARALVFLFTLTAFNNIHAQLTYTESFDGTTFLPAGWTAVANSNYWSRKTNGTNPACTPHSGAGMARFYSHSAAAGAAQTIATPVIDYSTRAGHTPTFSLWLFRDTAKATAGDSLSIFINTAANLTGATELGVIARAAAINLPNTVVTPGWYQYSFNIPAGYSTSTNYILLEGTSQFGNNIFIDDVAWVAYPALCTGTPAPGSMVINTPVICGGTGSTSIVLSGEATGFAGLSYVWESASSASGPWSVIDTAVTAINSGTITSTTYYKYVTTCSYSSASDSITDSVVVSANPVPVITVTPGIASYCTGSAPTTLAASGAALYTWTPASGLNTDISDTVLASPASTTRYTVTGVDSLGCYGSATVNVTVHAAPAAGITVTANPICPGGSTMLKDTVLVVGFGLVTYAWAPDSANIDSITVAPVSTTTYYATATSGGCSTTDSLKVTVNPIPQASFTYSVTDTTVTFSNNSASATGYIWVLGTGDTSVLQNPVNTYNGPGTYPVTLIAEGPCGNDTLSSFVTVNPVGIASIPGAMAVTVWPNPANNTASVLFTSPELKAELWLTNELGQEIENRIVTPKTGGQFKEDLNLSGLPAGVYIVHIHAVQKDVCMKLVKM